MIVYEATKDQFLDAVLRDTITDDIYRQYRRHFGNSSESQVRSWYYSMEFMYKVISDVRIPADAGIAIEFNIPTTAKRVDFIISGMDAEDRSTAVVIELKQWESCTRVSGKDGIVLTYVGKALREVTHPSYQADSYCQLLSSFSEPVQTKPIDLHPCAYLHNYRIADHPDLIDGIYRTYLEEAPVFGQGDALKLRAFIDRYIVKGDRGASLYEISEGRLCPSRSLQDTLSSMLDGNPEFTMIDDQKVVFEQALALARECRSDRTKRVLIVSGGPGTGKTVVAVNLLVSLTREGMTAQYVTKNQAPRDVYFEKLRGHRHETSPRFLFKGSGCYIDAPENCMDVLLADEAHRLNEKSGIYHNQGENQIKEIIHASILSVFFIDEDQRVTLNDIGTVAEIERHARAAHAEICTMKLESQFRCNGSDGYLAWVDQLLEIRETANRTPGFDYDFRVFDDPNELRKAIRERNASNKARMVAGYCWDWISDGKNDPGVTDINLPDYDFHMSWNLSASGPWAIGADSIEQCGCIHTCQGLEFDYVGVLIGGDLRYEGGHVITDDTKRARTDQSLKGLQKMKKKDPRKAAEAADAIIRNTYRTLMTRGMKGCYVFCTDRALADYIRSQLKLECGE